MEHVFKHIAHLKMRINGNKMLIKEDNYVCHKHDNANFEMLHYKINRMHFNENHPTTYSLLSKLKLPRLLRGEPMFTSYIVGQSTGRVYEAGKFASKQFFERNVLDRFMHIVPVHIAIQQFKPLSKSEMKMKETKRLCQSIYTFMEQYIFEIF